MGAGGAECSEQWCTGLLSHLPLQTGVEQYNWCIVKYFQSRQAGFLH